MTLLILGGTGTLGSQIVREALNQGYEVRCLVRNLRKAKFLREWGADLIKADLTKPETLTGAFEGVKIVIDASAGRPSEPLPLENTDLVGKEHLIRVAKIAKIKHFISFSLINNQKHLDIPSMKIKSLVEENLKTSGLKYTIFQIPAFYQGLIGQYGIPLLENNPILLINENSKIPYIDTSDVAKIVIKALNLETIKNQCFQICGPKAWSSNEIIKLCEKLSGQQAKIRTFPVPLIQFSKNITSFFEWSWPIANRLLFLNVLDDLNVTTKEKQNFYNAFSLTEEDFSTLENYFKDYFEKILQDLQKLNFQKPKDLLF